LWDCTPSDEVMRERGLLGAAWDRAGKPHRLPEARFTRTEADLLSAIRRHNRREVLSILAQGAQLHAESPAGETALSVAVRSEAGELVDLLLQHGATPTHADLHAALETRQIGVVERLLGRELDLNQPMPDGLTPLIWAVRLGDPELVSRMLALGADVSLTDKSGKTPADHAAARENLAGFPDVTYHYREIDDRLATAR
jgi:hypothetical protein